MSHHHDHSHVHEISSLSTSYYIAMALNIAFVFVEVIVGLRTDSMILVSDAAHKLMDVLTLLIALVSFKLAQKGSTKMDKTARILTLINVVILFLAVLHVVHESVEKFGASTYVDGAAISWTAGLGIIVNGISAFLLMQHQKGDNNTKVAFLHFATDVLVSIGVVLSGILIKLTGWSLVDPIISLLIAAVIMVNIFRILRNLTHYHNK